MKIRSVDGQTRKITFPDGQVFSAPPDGITVPEHLEREARQLVDLNEHIEEVTEPKKTAAPKPEGKE